jgi:hypothetical protein
MQLSRKKGWKMPENTVKVDRTTKWGNPFIVGEHGTRAECVRLFEYLLGGLLCISANNCEAQEAYMAMARCDLEQLRGKNLACWCPLDAPCHADVLLVMANAKVTGSPALSTSPCGLPGYATGDNNE